LWDLVADGLLVQLNKEGLHRQGYADDLALLITGKFPNAISELMQRTLKNIKIKDSAGPRNCQSQ
jgi:hypothetical protein